MQKKVGIIAAVSAASLIGLSPLAFADGGIDSDAHGAVAGLNGNNVQVPVEACNNEVPVNVLGVQVPVEDAAAGNGVTGAANGAAGSGDSASDQSDACGQEAGAGDTASR